MASTTRWIFAVIVVLGISRASIFAADAAPPKDADAAAAMKVLARWVGTWDEETTIKPGKWVPGGAKTTSVMTYKMTQNGRYLRGEGEGFREHDGKKPRDTITLIRTYSLKHRAFLTWAFLTVTDDDTIDHWSGGEVITFGKWDEAEEKMTYEFVDKERAVTGKGSIRWIDKDRAEWGHTVENENGEVVFQQSGKATRRKEK